MKRILWVITVMAFSANLSAPLFPLYGTQFHLNNAAITALFAVYAVCLLPTLLLAGTIGDANGLKLIAVTGVLIALISAALFTAATDSWMLYLARAFEGIAIGAFMGTGTALLLQNTSFSHISRALTLSSMATMIGFGLGPAVSGLILQYCRLAPERLPYLILLLTLLSALIVLLSVQEKRRKRTQPFRLRLGVPHAGLRLFWGFIAPAVFVLFALNGTVIALIPTYAHTVMHTSNLAWSGFLILVLLGGGGLAQQIQWPNQAAHRVQSGIVLLLLGTWCMLLAGIVTSMWLLWLGMAVQSVGSGFTFQGSMQLAGNLSTPVERAQTLSTFYVAAYIGMIVPTLAVGFFASVWGLMDALIALGIASTALGLATLLVSAHGSIRAFLRSSRENIRYYE